MMTDEDEFEALVTEVSDLIKNKYGHRIDHYELSEALVGLLSDVGIEILDEAA